MSKYKAVMYRNPICGKCAATKLQLEKVMDVEERVMGPDGKYADTAQWFKDHGITTSPVVYIQDENDETVDSWSNFQISKIQKWVRRAKDEK